MTVTPAATTTYTATASGPGGPRTASVTITHAATPPLSSYKQHLLSHPATIQAGQSATLKWTTANAASADIQLGIGAVGLNGEMQVMSTSTQFATSVFASLMAGTIPNRMYLFAATSFGHVWSDQPPDTGWPQKTIFDVLHEHGIRWKYYYQDNSVFLGDFAAFNDPAIRSNVRHIQSYYDILSQPDADQKLSAGRSSSTPPSCTSTSTSAQSAARRRACPRHDDGAHE